jgi:Ca-activated chloride channel family protein
MDFAHPGWLGLLVLVPLLAVRAGWSGRRRAREWLALGRGGRPPGDGTWTGLGMMTLLLVALAGPRWGLIVGPEPPPGQEVMLLIDLSRSMAAEDAVPDRLGLAVAAAEQVVRAAGREPGSRVGVVAFAGRGVPRCPPTGNLGAVVEVLESLRTGTVQPGGTDLGAALEAARYAFGPDPGPHATPSDGRSIVLLSDGEDLAGNWRTALDRLRADRIPVHAVAVGDAERGHPIPVRTRPDGARKPLVFDGQTVLSRRDDGVLRAVATATGGAFLPLGLARPEGIESLFAARIAPEARLRSRESRPIERADQYAAFTLAALFVGLVVPVFGRAPRTLLGLAFVVVLAGAATFRSAEDAVQAGNRAYSESRWDDALAAFERATVLDPNSATARYDAAATLFRLGRFEEAAARYGEARKRADAGLRTRIDFALGNTAFALGDRAGALRHYDACLASRARGSTLDAVRRDAAINRRFVEQYREPAEDEGSSPRPDTGRSASEPPPESERNPASEPKKPSTAEGPEPSTESQSKAASNHLESQSRPDTVPRRRLDEAVDRVRDALRRRIPDEPLDVPDGRHKDW